MKFLCDQCKAKYQIADEKVVGKTVKMKCRKCGHMIEVRAAVTDAVEAAPISQGAASTTDVTSPARSGIPRSASSATTMSQAPMATNLSRMPQQRPSQTSLDAVRPGTTPHASNALAGAFASSVGVGAGKEDAPSSRSLGLSPADEWYVAINGVPVGPVRVGELRRKAASGAMTEDSLCWQEGFEEWRPVRSVPELAVMVREAQSSGRPSLTGIPAQPAGDRPSSAPPPRPPSRPAIQRVSLPATAAVSAPSASSPMAPAASPVAAQVGQMSGASARSNVVPIAGRLATAERMHPEDAETFVGPNPSQPTPQPASRPAPVTPAVAAAAVAAPVTPSVAPDPFGVPPTAASPAVGFAAPLPAASPFTVPASPASAVPNAPLGFDPVVSHAPPAPARRQLSVPAMAMIAMCGLFGVTAAVALFFRAPAAPAVTTASSAATATGTPSATSAAVAQTDIPPPDKIDDPAAATTAATAAHTNSGASPSGTKPTASAASASAKPVDPSIAALLSGGPSNGPSAGNGNGNGNGSGSLTQDQIESVVRSRSAQVKRTCWERGGSGKSNNTTVAMTIAGNGTVSSANASGNDPAMSACIEKAVKGWVFPASGGSTPVNIPFHFVAQ